MNLTLLVPSKIEGKPGCIAHCAYTDGVLEKDLITPRLHRVCQDGYLCFIGIIGIFNNDTRRLYIIYMTTLIYFKCNRYIWLKYLAYL